MNKHKQFNIVFKLIEFRALTTTSFRITLHHFQLSPAFNTTLGISLTIRTFTTKLYRVDYKNSNGQGDTES